MTGSDSLFRPHLCVPVFRLSFSSCSSRYWVVSLIIASFLFSVVMSPWYEVIFPLNSSLCWCNRPSLFWSCAISFIIEFSFCSIEVIWSASLWEMEIKQLQQSSRKNYLKVLAPIMGRICSICLHWVSALFLGCLSQFLALTICRRLSHTVLHAKIYLDKSADCIAE